MALLLVRHGETTWSRDGKHTSVTDLPLTPEGEHAATALRSRIAEHDVVRALVSPRLRARRTAELIGFEAAEVTEDLVEWNYGELEGRTTPEIREDLPGWTIWSGPVPGGEDAAAVSARCDAVIAGLRGSVDLREQDALVVAHGHVLRVLAARWLGLPATEGRLFRLDTARLSSLGYEREQPVLLAWNA